jgi:UDP-glucose 4-epimerase
MKNLIIITGGAGFIGSNLIKYLLKNTNFKIISLDNYSTGTIKNHTNHKNVKYFKGNNIHISKILRSYRKKIKVIFHFGEFSRIYQSFLNTKECINSNIYNSFEVINFAKNNMIKIIYSATSSNLGNNGKDQNSSPYTWSKSKNIELIKNYSKWFDLKFEILYFYNVYGPGQIETGPMSTVIGIFENQFKRKLPLTVVRPGSQSRRFTHINDTVEACYYAWKKNQCKHYSISNRKSYTITEVAKLFNVKIKLLPTRKGERYASALTSMNLSNKVHKLFGKINLKDYVRNIVKNH